jgi:hypothetical protein
MDNLLAIPKALTALIESGFWPRNRAEANRQNLPGSRGFSSAFCSRRREDLFLSTVSVSGSTTVQEAYLS